MKYRSGPRYRRGSRLGELALYGPPPSTSCPRASKGQDQKDNRAEEGGYKADGLEIEEEEVSLSEQREVGIQG
jgi:hypothetical protein